jgi:hypothetical protein
MAKLNDCSQRSEGFREVGHRRSPPSTSGIADAAHRQLRLLGSEEDAA